MSNPAAALDDVTSVVCDSALRQFVRLNPDHRWGSGDAVDAALPIYDWEIVADTGIALEAVRESLRNLDGVWVVVNTTNDEHRVVRLTSPESSPSA